MLRYTNKSLSTKTFYGVTFKPGETKEVKGFINHPKFVRVNSSPKIISKSADSKAAVDDKKQGGKSIGTDSNK